GVRQKLVNSDVPSGKSLHSLELTSGSSGVQLDSDFPVPPAQDRPLCAYLRQVQPIAENLPREIAAAAVNSGAGGCGAVSSCKFKNAANFGCQFDWSWLAERRIPVNSAIPGNSGAAADLASRMLPCCKIAHRRRRWALPAILCPFTRTSPRVCRWKQRNGSVAGGTRKPAHKDAATAKSAKASMRLLCTARYRFSALNRCDSASGKTMLYVNSRSCRMAPPPVERRTSTQFALSECNRRSASH